MRKLLFALMPILMLIAGCSTENGLLGPTVTDVSSESLALGKTTGTMIESATFYIYVDIPSNQLIDVHRITSDWGETTVTWNNFGGAYASGVEGSFLADGSGWRSVDVTALVDSWMMGDYDNFGMLLRQSDEEFPRTNFYSRYDSDLQPYLEVCYSDGCEDLYATADVYIYEGHPDSNFNSQEWLWTGRWADGDPEKQTLIRFEFDTEPPSEGCTRTIGYWKTHSGCFTHKDEISDLLPIWLGDADGEKSVLVKRNCLAKRILKRQLGRSRNGISKLYAQLLAAKLNFASGASSYDVDDVVAAADAFLAEHGWRSWRHLSHADKQMVLGWMTTLDNYNNGLIGPGHCDEDGGGCGGGCGGGHGRDRGHGHRGHGGCGGH